MGRGARAILLVGSLVVGPVGADADDLSSQAPHQKEVGAVMEVLRQSGADPSSSCLSALDEMHTTDQQLQQLVGSIQNNNETEPVVQHQSGEISVARDVLATDIVDMLASCRPEAEQACATRSGPSLAASCAKLGASAGPGPSGRR